MSLRKNYPVQKNPKKIKFEKLKRKKPARLTRKARKKRVSVR